MCWPLLPVEKKGHASRGQGVGNGMAPVALQVHIQHGGVKNLLPNKRGGLLDRRS
jgi:hypothetical protein